MRRFIFFLLTAILLTACGKRLLSHEAAREAAVAYYTMLIDGDYEAFVDGYTYAATMPDDYRSQMVDAVAQTMASGMMHELRAVTAVADSLADSTAYVRLELQFADSTCQHIGLPLVLHPDGWRMQ